MPPPLPPAPPAPAPHAQGRRTSTLAIVSLVSGLLGWTVLPMLGSVVAIITGHLARSELRANPAAMEGDGLAIAGLVLGYAMVALALAGLLLAVVFFGGLAALFALSNWS